MAEFVFFYADRPERGTIIGRENSLGNRLLHDDFIDENGDAQMVFFRSCHPKITRITALINNQSDYALNLTTFCVF